MNYIPGFSNYLETSVPRYADGGAVMDPYRKAAVMPMAMRAAPAENVYQPAVQPMTTAAAPFDLSKIDFSKMNISGLGGFGGGRMGGVIETPNQQYITAPISNKGNPTGKMGGNVFVMKPDQQVRLIDHRTNQIVFEGTGYDAARKATQLGQSMTDQYGRKANYSIQTSDPTGNYTTVAYEKRNKSTLGKIGSIAGTALPIAVSLIPGLQFAGPVLSAALAGGAGAALKGDNILKGAALGGLSAAGGQVLGSALGAGGALGTNLAPKLATAIGTGLGSTAGGLVTGQSLKNSLLGGVASGALSYVAPDIQRELGINPKSGSIFRGGDTSASTGGADSSAVYGGPNADIIVNATPFSTPNIKLGGFKTPTEKYLNDAATDSISDPNTGLPYSSGYDGNIINVTGSVPGAVTGGLNLGGFAPAAQQPAVDGVAPEDLITVTGQRPGAVTGGLPVTTPPVVPPATDGIAPEDLITVTGQRPGAVTGGLPVTTPPVVSPNDIVVTGPGKTEPGPGFTLSPDTVTDANQKSEAERKAEEERKKLGLEEYLRIAGLLSGLVGGAGGGGSDQAGTYNRGGLNPIFSAKLPTANIPGGVGAASNLDARPMGEEDWLTYGTRPERSFYEYVPQPTGMAEGGMFAAKRGGSPDRTEFAVNGPGTGRSDDIPAVLSDGEYVIDAETVALLGDGSSKAGAKKLDDLRVKVRKHKGQKLAKGRFSANAKKPEAYLSGGRI